MVRQTLLIRVYRRSPDTLLACTAAPGNPNASGRQVRGSPAYPPQQAARPDSPTSPPRCPHRTDSQPPPIHALHGAQAGRTATVFSSRHPCGARGDRPVHRPPWSGVGTPDGLRHDTGDSRGESECAARTGRQAARRLRFGQSCPSARPAFRHTLRCLRQGPMRTLTDPQSNLGPSPSKVRHLR